MKCKERIELKFEYLGCQAIWIPVVRYCMESAAHTHIILKQFMPEALVLELPNSHKSLLMQAVSRLPNPTLFIEEDDNKLQKNISMIEPCDAIFESLRWSVEHGIETNFIRSQAHAHIAPFPSIDPYCLNKISLSEYVHTLSQLPISHQVPLPDLFLCELLPLFARHSKIAIICEIPSYICLKDIDLRKVTPSNLAEKEEGSQRGEKLLSLTQEQMHHFFAEPSFITLGYEEFRREGRDKIPDRMELIEKVLLQSCEDYRNHLHIEVSPLDIYKVFKFALRRAKFERKLVPSFYDMIGACKAIVDPELAYLFWEKATRYPEDPNIDNLDTDTNLTIQDVWSHHKKISFELKRRSPKSQPYFKRRPLRSNFPPPKPGQVMLCSYPPEDQRIESYGRQVKKKSWQKQSFHTLSSEKFQDSFHHGLDLKNTIYSSAKRKDGNTSKVNVQDLYVWQQTQKHEEPNCVVFIFTDEKLSENYEFPWKMCWYGEDEQESDMAFYSTAYGNYWVGPGICRCHYGGYILSYPPRRLQNIWDDPDYIACENKSDVLIMAAIDYSTQESVPVVCARAITSKLRRYARIRGKKIHHIPLGSISAMQRQRLQTFHVLDSPHRRKNAQEYID